MAFASRCTQQRCSRISGHTEPTAAQKRSALSPVTTAGQLKPRRFKSRSTVAQLSVRSL
jgi:hypothetical protein